jgi:hypothetical protein
MSAALPIAIIGGVTYALTRQDADPSAPPAPVGGPTRYGASGTAQPGATVAQVSAVRISPTKYQIKNMPSRTLLGAAPTQKATGWATDINIDPELQKKLALIEAAAHKAFDDANEVAHAQAAETLNKELKLDPPLTGHEDWKTVGAVAGGAVGGVVGAYFGGPLGAKIGALVGAYLGTKLADLLAKNWDELKSWVSDKWGDVKDWVSDTAEDAYDWAAGVVSF